MQRNPGFDLARAPSATPADFAPPAGAFLVLYDDGRPCGCAGLKPIGGGMGELKRMWVEPGTRRRGHARRLLSAVEEEAQRLGLEALRLDTWADMEEAHALYRSAGFREVDDYNGNPYSAHWFEKRLA